MTDTIVHTIEIADSKSGNSNLDGSKEIKNSSGSMYTQYISTTIPTTITTNSTTTTPIHTSNNNSSNNNNTTTNNTTTTTTTHTPLTSIDSVLHKNAPIEANLRGEGVWYPGTVLTDYGSGVHYNVAITLHDGSVMQCKMKRKFLRAITTTTDNAVVSSSSGNNNNNSLSSDKALVVLENKMDSVTLTDTVLHGSRDGNGGGISITGRTGPIQEGDKVQGNYHGSGQWYPAVVDRVRGDGTVDLDYDDGDREVRMDLSLVRHPPPATTITTPTTTAATATNSTSSSTSVHNQSMISAVVEPDIPFQEGDEVEGNYHGSGAWHAAVVDRVRADGTFDLDYDNGD